MNKCRSKKLMWKLNKSIAKDLLPTQPVDFPIEPWWGVCLVNFTLEEFKKLSEEETATIDKICKEEANSYVLFDMKIIDDLYKRGLVYFDVPVYTDDRFKVSRLEGFVSNKDQSYEDPIEELLYAVFVVSSANATVAELAATLQADLYQLQAAASFACRLGWAVKLVDGDSVFKDEGLKSHAVTLYEAGKLGDSCIAELCSDLASLEGKKFEGVLEEFANHAFSLRWSLECLKSGGVSTDDSTDKDGETKTPTNLLHENVTAHLANANIEDRAEDGLGKVPQDNCSTGVLDNKDENISSVSMGLPERGENMVRIEAQNDSTGTNVLMIKRKYSVDVLRCESLASLAPATLERLFLRDYDIIVSMVPLPSSSVLPGPSGTIHFGPPSYSAMTPWMKLVLYTAGHSGPLSAVFLKGQRFRLLPEPLAGCEKALIWSWDGSMVGGLGGKFEGNLVKGNLLLHCLNSMLKQSAVLVQPLRIDDLSASGNLVTVDIPLPLKNDDHSIASVVAQANLPKEQVFNLTSVLKDLSSKFQLTTLGYLRLLRLNNLVKSDKFHPENASYQWVPLSLEFGIPLFNPNLCERICERVVASRILQKDDLTEHYDVMQNVRRRLRELCSEYQATGPVAKLYNKRGNSKDLPRTLINSISSRWDPANDPTAPTNTRTPSEHERLKLAVRQRCGTEVVGFDGRTVRSYSLSPEQDEATTKHISDKQSSTHEGKPDQEDAHSKDVTLPGLNLIFDGVELHPFDIGACLQGRQPLWLIADASTVSSTLI
ncbi:hypothetical protein ACQJBY_022423 [Aegilops geniculata]